MSWKIDLFFSQAIDQNLDYGEVYEGKEMSKTTDVNPDYDYDSTYISDMIDG